MNLKQANWTVQAGRDWHVAWYHESLRIVDAFVYKNRHFRYYNNYEGGTNLCHYARTTLIYAPGILLLHLLLPFAVAVALVFVPIAVVGVSGFLKMWVGFGIVGALLFAGYCIAIRDEPPVTDWTSRFGRWLYSWLNPVGKGFQHIGGRAALRNQEGVSLWSISGAFIVALKHQVCPLINIKEKE